MFFTNLMFSVVSLIFDLTASLAMLLFSLAPLCLLLLPIWVIKGICDEANTIHDEAKTETKQ